MAFPAHRPPTPSGEAGNGPDVIDDGGNGPLRGRDDRLLDRRDGRPPPRASCFLPAHPAKKPPSGEGRRPFKCPVAASARRAILPYGNVRSPGVLRILRDLPHQLVDVLELPVRPDPVAETRPSSPARRGSPSKAERTPSTQPSEFFPERWGWNPMFATPRLKRPASRRRRT